MSRVCAMACMSGRQNCTAGCCACDQNGNPVPQPPAKPFACPTGQIISPDGHYCCATGRVYDPNQTGCVSVSVAPEPSVTPPLIPEPPSFFEANKWWIITLAFLAFIILLLLLVRGLSRVQPPPQPAPMPPLNLQVQAQ